MKLSSLLDSSLIFVDSQASTKNEAIEALLTAIYGAYDVGRPRAEVLQTIMDRESHGSTTYPTGIAIPHGRLDNFDDCVVGILVPKTPFKDGATDVRMVVLILTSKLGSNLYLKTLSAFAKLSKDAELFGRLVSVSSGHAFLGILDQAKIDVDKELTVVDIMSSDFQRIDPKLSIKELVDTFYGQNIAWSVVTGADDRLLGVITLFEVVGRGIPNYASLMGNLAFLPKLRPFEDLLKEEDRLRVEDLMSKPVVVLSPSMSIIEAAFEMTQHHRGTAPVVQDGKVIGVLSLADIMTKYLRG